MVGFVGVQARRRMRNRLFFIFLIIIIFLFIFYLPRLEFSTEDKVLPNEILPDTVDDKSSLISNIEELKLEVFQKDQRIKFRDNQIKNLKEEIKYIKQAFLSLENEHNKTLGNFAELENNLYENSSENFNEISKLKDDIDKLNYLINEYKEQITNLKKEINNSVSNEDLQQINIENSILKSQIKLIKEKNIKAENSLKELRFLIDEKQKEIDKLLYIKDTGHHG